MMRLITLASLFGVLLLDRPATVRAQDNPITSQLNQYLRPGTPADDPRARRAQRERAVASFGQSVRGFVETHGDDAVSALFGVSKPVALKLAEFYARGDLAKIPKPQELLRLIARPGYGDDVALWAMEHEKELEDIDNLNAYLTDPLDYALGLKRLSQGAAESRASRLSMPTSQSPQPAFQLNDQRMIAVVIGAVAIVALLAWRKR